MTDDAKGAVILASIVGGSVLLVTIFILLFPWLVALSHRSSCAADRWGGLRGSDAFAKDCVTSAPVPAPGGAPQ